MLVILSKTHALNRSFRYLLKSHSLRLLCFLSIIPVSLSSLINLRKNRLFDLRIHPLHKVVPIKIDRELESLGLITVEQVGMVRGEVGQVCDLSENERNSEWTTKGMRVVPLDLGVQNPQILSKH